jgi:NTE family protein
MKLGLALSGGGFRASFFHVGLLARMAELGLLRHVEVISTVSGGSILGALYYVKLKRLLDATPDDAVQDAHYVRLVEDVERALLDAVQTNIRLRAFVNVARNFRMTLPNYSRSDRLGELYDALLYRPAFDAGRARMVEMRELKIQPPGPPGFHPEKDNGARKAKVPVLLVNATMLNTGHAWRFEASTMGPWQGASATAQDVDKNMRLLRPDAYAQMATGQQNVELGLAVAASACVPGIFPPLAISALYAGDVRVQLVDGGVHDNQGVAGLIEKGCTHLVVSDASGQLDDLDDPATPELAVILRANGILMDRVREEELCDVLESRRIPAAFVHLRKSLPVRRISYYRPDGKTLADPAADGEPAAPALLPYGVRSDVQDALSNVRTDLDSFSEIEAYALMLDGYLIAGQSIREQADLAALVRESTAPGKGRWRFTVVQPWMAQPTPLFLRHLQIAHERLFKVFRLSPGLAVVTVVAALALAGALVWWQADALAALWRAQVGVAQLAKWIAVPLLALLAVFAIPWASGKFQPLEVLRWPLEYVQRFVLRGLIGFVFAVFVALYLATFERCFLRLGRVARLR